VGKSLQIGRYLVNQEYQCCLGVPCGSTTMGAERCGDERREVPILPASTARATLRTRRMASRSPRPSARPPPLASGRVQR
jgi:hypothetical protein